MTHVLTLVAKPNSGGIDQALRALITAGITPWGTSWLAIGEAQDLRLTERPATQKLHELLADIPVDWAVQLEEHRGKALFMSDMDSTMIENECIDELADIAGIGEQIAAITERTMRGELDFHESVTERVAALKGLPKAALDSCYRERIRFSPGADLLLETLNSLSIQSVLVSGGFTYFTERVAARLGFHRHFANVLDIDGDQLTGRITPPVLGPTEKLDRLNSEIKERDIRRWRTLAIGDGANDLPMLEAAGLGIAYKAKPKVKQQASAVIDHTDLTSVLYFLGLPKTAFSN